MDHNGNLALEKQWPRAKRRHRSCKNWNNWFGKQDISVALSFFPYSIHWDLLIDTTGLSTYVDAITKSCSLKYSSSVSFLHLSHLEEEIPSLEYKVGYSNLTKRERDTVYSLKNDNSIIIKEADKGSAVVAWDRDDYLRESKNQLNDKNVYKELSGNAEGPLEKVIKTVLKKIRDRRDISDNTLDYFLFNNPKLGRFYLLPKIHKWLQNVPGWPVISNSGYYAENI